MAGLNTLTGGIAALPDFAALPPEINSARMYTGPGSAPMLAAATAWDALSGELFSAAAGYGSVISELGSQWLGPSSVAMTAAAAPYLVWLHGTAAAAEQTAAQARAAAAAYELAFAMTAPPAVIAANRGLLAALIATNLFGQNAPAIATTEAHYAAMWAQDTAVMNGYAVSAAAASNLPPLTGPPAVAAAKHPVAAAPSAGNPAQPVSLAPFTAIDRFNNTVSTLSGAASVSSSSFGGASIGTANHAIMINAERDTHQGLGPFLGIGPGPTAPAAPAAGGRQMAAGLMGRASIAGTLSVPQAWAATLAAPVGPGGATALASGTATTTPAAYSPGLFGESMLGTLAGRGVSNAIGKARRPSVIPRSPAAG